MKVKVKVNLYLSTPRTDTGGGEVWRHSFLTSTLSGHEYQLHALGALLQDRTPVTTELQTAAGSTSKPGRFAADINLLPLPAITTMTELSRLLMLK